MTTDQWFGEGEHRWRSELSTPGRRKLRVVCACGWASKWRINWMTVIPQSLHKKRAPGAIIEPRALRLGMEEQRRHAGLPS
jgi:hypothetical protein